MRDFTSRGKTVLFATHYLEEADEYADRIVLMARGRVVADGPSSEIKATVGSRTIQATLPGAKTAALSGLPGVAGVDSWGTMGAVVSSGARIATERAAGWNRQLRLTPLSARTYLRAKVVGGYVIAAMSIVLLYVAGVGLGVRLPAGRWLAMTALI